MIWNPLRSTRRDGSIREIAGTERFVKIIVQACDRNVHIVKNGIRWARGNKVRKKLWLLTSVRFQIALEEIEAHALSPIEFPPKLAHMKMQARSCLANIFHLIFTNVGHKILQPATNNSSEFEWNLAAKFMNVKNTNVPSFATNSKQTLRPTTIPQLPRIKIFSLGDKRQAKLSGATRGVNKSSSNLAWQAKIEKFIKGWSSRERLPNS